jgi:hypothetical protein
MRVQARANPTPTHAKNVGAEGGWKDALMQSEAPTTDVRLGVGVVTQLATRHRHHYPPPPPSQRPPARYQH